MVESPNVWTDALPAWVPLAELLDRVARHLGIPPEKSRHVLRSQLEAGGIFTEVLGWEAGTVADRRDRHRTWTGINPFREHAVSHQGWGHLCWETGTLAGCEVRVEWDGVSRTLKRHQASLQARAADALLPVKGKGGRPPHPNIDEFWIEVALFIGENDYNRQDRLKLQKQMENWAVQASDDPDKPIYTPDTIREKLGLLYDRAEARTKALAGNRVSPG